MNEKKRTGIGEKIMLVGSIITLIVGIIIKGIVGCNDAGILVALAFVGILLWVILAASAFFPADWRMTERQKAKISDMEKYQCNYRKAFIAVDMVVAIAFAILIVAIA